MILFFGPAGAGKSVQGQMLAERENWPWVSTGKLFRESQDPEIQRIIAQGILISSEVTQNLLAETLDGTRNQQVILDGFPRKIEQAEWLMENQKEYEYKVDLVIVVDVTKEEILKRLALRGRTDDDPSIIEERLNIYHQEVDPILNYLTEQDVSIVHVDGIGQVEDIHEQVIAEVSKANLV